MLSLVPLDVKKAYVITISHTGQSLLEQNKVLFFGPSKQKFTGLNNEFPVLLPIVSRFLWWVSRLYSKKYFARVAVIFVRSIMELTLHLKQKSLRNFAIWSRDLRTCIHTANMELPTLCEVHKELTRREISSLRKLARHKPLALGPISNHLSRTLHRHNQNLELDLPISLLPMAVTSSFYALNVPELDYTRLNRIKIGYFGSYETMRVRSGIDQFLVSLSQIPKLKFEVLIVGIGHSGKLKLETLMHHLKTPNIRTQLVEYVDHKEIPSLMQNCHILVLPYLEGDFNLGRFPIKTVEYAASRVPILCSNTTANHQILNSQKAFFYDINDSSSINTALQQIINNKELRKTTVDRAYFWSLNLNYESRAQKVLKAIKEAQTLIKL